MSTGPGLPGWRTDTRREAESTVEIVVIPPALYTLRAIVLGAAAVIGIIGVLAFVQVPDVTSGGRAGAAAGFTSDEIGSRPDCEVPCLGHAVGVQELDALPVGLDARALAVVTRAEPEPPWAATPPPTARRQPPTAPDDDHNSDDEEDEDEEKDEDEERERDEAKDKDKDGKEKKDGGSGGAKAESPGKGQGKDRDEEDGDD